MYNLDGFIFFFFILMDHPSKMSTWSGLSSTLDVFYCLFPYDVSNRLPSSSVTSLFDSSQWHCGEEVSCLCQHSAQDHVSVSDVHSGLDQTKTKC